MSSLQLLECLSISLVVRARLALDLLDFLWGDVGSPCCRALLSPCGPMGTEGLAAVRTEVSQANHLSCH